MTSDSLPLRVTRLENDTDAIYEILTGIQQKQTEHDARFDQVDARFDQVDARFEQMDTAVTRMGTQIAEVLRRLPGSA